MMVLSLGLVLRCRLCLHVCSVSKSAWVGPWAMIRSLKCVECRTLWVVVASKNRGNGVVRSACALGRGCLGGTTIAVKL